MARSRARFSRALIAFLIIAVVLGIVFQVHRIRASQATVRLPTDPVVPIVRLDPAPVQAAPTASGSVAATPAGASSPLPSSAVALVTSTPTPIGNVQASSASGKLKLSGLSSTTQPAGGDSSKTGSASASASAAITASSATPKPAVANPALVSVSRNLGGNPITDAKAQWSANYPLQARQILNDAMLGGQLSADDFSTARQLLSQINQQVLLGPKQYPEDPFGGVVTVKPGQRLSSIATEHDITWELLGRLNNLPDPRKLKAGRTLKIIKGPFHAVVSKSKFMMDLYLGSPGEAGSLYVMSYPVGLGRDDSTPTGTWQIEPHHKIKHPTYYSPRGEGVIAAEDPKNPLGPYWLGLVGTNGQAVGKASYGIHGTIEPDSIGKMASMGCIRMHNEDVAVVFDLLVEGKSTVIVKD